jgi:hypothetical protein
MIKSLQHSWQRIDSKSIVTPFGILPNSEARCYARGGASR